MNCSIAAKPFLIRAVCTASPPPCFDELEVIIPFAKTNRWSGVSISISYAVNSPIYSVVLCKLYIQFDAIMCANKYPAVFCIGCIILVLLTKSYIKNLWLGVQMTDISVPAMLYLCNRCSPLLCKATTGVGNVLPCLSAASTKSPGFISIICLVRPFAILTSVSGCKQRAD